MYFWQKIEKQHSKLFALISCIRVLSKLFAIYILRLTSIINYDFGIYHLHTKSKYFHVFAIIANLKYKYFKCNFSCRESDVKVFEYFELSTGSHRNEFHVSLHIFKYEGTDVLSWGTVVSWMHLWRRNLRSISIWNKTCIFHISKGQTWYSA